jgi:hypothetical protein
MVMVPFGDARTPHPCRPPPLDAASTESDDARSVCARTDHVVRESAQDWEAWRARQTGNGVRVPPGLGGSEIPPAFLSSPHRCEPGPKGPSAEPIADIVETKRSNPRFGYVRIAQQIAHAFGVEIDKDIVRRVLAKHWRPGDLEAESAGRLTTVCGKQNLSANLNQRRMSPCPQILRGLLAPDQP